MRREPDPAAEITLSVLFGAIVVAAVALGFGWWRMISGEDIDRAPACELGRSSTTLLLWERPARGPASG